MLCLRKLRTGRTARIKSAAHEIFRPIYSHSRQKPDLHNPGLNNMWMWLADVWLGEITVFPKCAVIPCLLLQLQLRLSRCKGELHPTASAADLRSGAGTNRQPCRAYLQAQAACRAQAAGRALAKSWCHWSEAPCWATLPVGEASFLAGATRPRQWNCLMQVCE